MTMQLGSFVPWVENPVASPAPETPSARRARPGAGRPAATSGPRTGGRGLLSPDIVKSGYMPRSEAFDAVFNIAVVCLFLAVAAPLIAMLALMVKATSRGPAFYAGRRIGKDGRIFHIYKLRTLHVSAAAMTANGTLPRRSTLETRFGSYLRRTRLDELPQLFNVLRRDMSLFGPRPIRPELLPIYEAETDNLDIRFTVRPGLVGFSQALLPHGASKRLRGRFVSMCCRAPIRYGFMLRFVLGVGLQVVQRGVGAMFSAGRDVFLPEGRHHFLRSGFSRPRGTTVQIERAGEDAVAAEVCGLSDEVAQFVLTRPLADGPCRFHIQRQVSNGRIVRLSLEADIVSVMPIGIGRSGFLGYAMLHPSTRYATYRLERNFLDQTVLKC